MLCDIPTKTDHPQKTFMTLSPNSSKPTRSMSSLLTFLWELSCPPWECPLGRPSIRGWRKESDVFQQLFYRFSPSMALKIDHQFYPNTQQRWYQSTKIWIALSEAVNILNQHATVYADRERILPEGFHQVVSLFVKLYEQSGFPVAYTHEDCLLRTKHWDVLRKCL